LPLSIQPRVGKISDHCSATCSWFNWATFEVGSRLETTRNGGICKDLWASTQCEIALRVCFPFLP
jgi:hypothetical protein